MCPKCAPFFVIPPPFVLRNPPTLISGSTSLSSFYLQTNVRPAPPWAAPSRFLLSKFFFWVTQAETQALVSELDQTTPDQ